MSKMQVDSQGDIDESLYSRQLYVLGREAMQRMSQSNVLIVGMRGLGVEIAKNVVLAGVKSVAIHDPHPVEIQDLSSQFFLHEADLGKSRAEVTASSLAELNTYVPVSVMAGELNEETLSKYQVVVLTDTVDIETQVRINEFTHKNGIKFISSELRGLFGKVFVDFGDEFTVFDPTGEEPLQGIVNEIEPDGTVMAVDEQRHGLEDGDWVQFSEVEGLEALNDGKPREIKVTGPFSFNIGDVSSLGVYKKGGQFLQVKRPKTLHFKTLAEQLAEPDFLISDFAKFDRPTQLHIGFLALQGFSNKHGHLPRPRNVEDANEVIHLAKNVQAQYPLVVEAELDEKLIRELSFQARGDLVPLAAVYGGLIAQEVLKACSGKFVPIHQWMYFDSLESLPKDHESVTEEDTAPRNSRYDGFYAVYGKKFHEKLTNLKIFLVGSGAIGCEMLKNWAMLGIGSGPEGKIIVTDNDSIEKSNLNRQFLFRPKDVGKEKSEVAAAAVAEMNSDLKGKIEHLSEKVGEDTENIFNDQFWNELDFVTNALDNVEARTYIDRRCVFFQKPLLESGTLGTKGNVQVVIPFLTESYSSSQDPPEKSIPLCTLRSFPNKIDHTIAWSKSLFQGYFAEAAENVNLYLTQPNYMESTLKQSGDQKGILETIYNSLVAQKPLTFEECIAWARVEFEKKFTNDIEQLLYNFPPDAVTSTGTPFWGGPKRVPTPLKFDIKNDNHLNFIVSAANLHAFNYGLKGGAELDTYERVLVNVEVPKFEPLKNVKIAADDAELANQDPIAADQAEISALLSKLPTPSSLAGFRLKPVEFEKDDDTNYHIDFITAGSNLRALNYGIEPADRSRTKFIAGRIIPAIATTTALVTGLVCLELFKVVDRENKTIEDFKNGFINLALPFFGFSEPMPSPKNKQGDFEFDETWGRFTIKGDVTIEKFIQIMREEHKLAVTMISSGSTLLYAQFFASAKLKDRLPMTFTQALESISKEPLPSGVRHLVVEICAEDEQGEDVDPLPYVALFF